MTIATAANRATQQLALSWKSLQRIVDAVYQVPDGINGPTNSHSTRRLFGQPQPKVVLFRDNHAWCPYCQKVWLFLEEKRVPYEVRKVTMFCYGQKEAWYKKLVPSGMLPALGFFEEGQTPTSAEPGKEGPSRAVTRFVTESDDILVELEKAFGPLNGISFGDPRVTQGRKLERRLFSAWCEWLCSPYSMEAKEVYRGTKSDFHTHVHDLPPQLGGCQFGSGASEGKIRSVNGAANLEEGVPVGVEVSESAYAEPRDARLEIVYRVARHWKNVQAVNPYGQAEGFDVGLRCVLTGLLQEQAEAEGAGAEGLRAALAAAVRAEEEAGGVLEIQGPLSADAGGGLRYVRDRVAAFQPNRRCFGFAREEHPEEGQDWKTVGEIVAGADALLDGFLRWLGPDSIHPAGLPQPSSGGGKSHQAWSSETLLLHYGNHKDWTSVFVYTAALLGDVSIFPLLTYMNLPHALWQVAYGKEKYPKVVLMVPALTLAADAITSMPDELLPLLAGSEEADSTRNQPPLQLDIVCTRRTATSEHPQEETAAAEAMDCNVPAFRTFLQAWRGGALLGRIRVTTWNSLVEGGNAPADDAEDGRGEQDSVGRLKKKAGAWRAYFAFHQEPENKPHPEPASAICNPRTNGGSLAECVKAPRRYHVAALQDSLRRHQMTKSGTQFFHKKRVMLHEQATPLSSGDFNNIFAKILVYGGAHLVSVSATLRLSALHRATHLSDGSYEPYYPRKLNRTTTSLQHEAEAEIFSRTAEKGDLLSTPGTRWTPKHPEYWMRSRLLLETAVGYDALLGEFLQEAVHSRYLSWSVNTSSSSWTPSEQAFEAPSIYLGEWGNAEDKIDVPQSAQEQLFVARWRAKWHVCVTGGGFPPLKMHEWLWSNGFCTKGRISNGWGSYEAGDLGEGAAPGIYMLEPGVRQIALEGWGPYDAGGAGADAAHGFRPLVGRLLVDTGQRAGDDASAVSNLDSVSWMVPRVPEDGSKDHEDIMQWLKRLHERKNAANNSALVAHSTDADENADAEEDAKFLPLKRVSSLMQRTNNIVELVPHYRLPPELRNERPTSLHTPQPTWRQHYFVKFVDKVFGQFQVKVKAGVRREAGEGDDAVRETEPSTSTLQWVRAGVVEHALTSYGQYEERFIENAVLFGSPKSDGVVAVLWLSHAGKVAVAAARRRMRADGAASEEFSAEEACLDLVHEVLRSASVSSDEHHWRNSAAREELQASEAGAAGNDPEESALFTTATFAYTFAPWEFPQHIVLAPEPWEYRPRAKLRTALRLAFFGAANALPGFVRRRVEHECKMYHLENLLLCRRDARLLEDDDSTAGEQVAVVDHNTTQELAVRVFVVDALLGCSSAGFQDVWDPHTCLLRDASGLLREPHLSQLPHTPLMTRRDRLHRLDDIPFHLWDLRVEVAELIRNASSSAPVSAVHPGTEARDRNYNGIDGEQLLFARALADTSDADFVRLVKSEVAFLRRNREAWTEHVALKLPSLGLLLRLGEAVRIRLENAHRVVSSAALMASVFSSHEVGGPEDESEQLAMGLDVERRIKEPPRGLAVPPSQSREFYLDVMKVCYPEWHVPEGAELRSSRYPGPPSAHDVRVHPSHDAVKAWEEAEATWDRKNVSIADGLAFDVTDLKRPPRSRAPPPVAEKRTREEL
eukprot:g55.t1